MTATRISYKVCNIINDEFFWSWIWIRISELDPNRESFSFPNNETTRRKGGAEFSGHMSECRIYDVIYIHVFIFSVTVLS
jgi:hypothetical protein